MQNQCQDSNCSDHKILEDLLSLAIVGSIIASG